MTFLNTQYTYDNLNRITKATDSSYLRYFMFDEFGNMSVTGNSNITLNGVTPTNVNGNGPVAYNTKNNHMVAGSVSYDARGNITALGGTGSVTLAFDAENNLKSETDSGTTFNWIYDAEGQRAEKQITNGATTVYVHDAFGTLAAEYTSSPGVTPACTTCYLSYDVMGSVKMVTDQQQFLVARHDYIPYGEAIPDGTANRTGDFEATSNVKQGFTGQESDGGTASMDFFNARHLSAAVGSFMQLDPMNAGADLTNPQSWNGYGYVLGNPLALVDPSGMSGIGSILSKIWSWINSPPSENDGTNGDIYDCAIGCVFVDTAYGTSGGAGGTTSGQTNPNKPGLPTPPNNGTRPCANVDPKNLDYITPRFYRSENRTVSPAIHINEGHILPVNDPKNSYYLFGNPITGISDPMATMAQVVMINRATFSWGTPAVQQNTNISFKLAFPPISIDMGFGILSRFGIGKSPSGNWLSTNTLIVDKNCTGVVTSFPSNP